MPRSLAAAGAVVATTAAALTLALGTAASAATSVRSPATTPADAAPAGLTWHKLTLINGWVSSQSGYGTGDPSWAVKDGIVYLSGSLHELSGGTPAPEFARLPRAARPAHFLIIAVYTVDGTTGHLDVNPGGAIDTSTAPVATNAENFTSLAGVSYPAARTVRHKLAMLHGWKMPPRSGAGAPAFSVVAGVVHLSGAMYQPHRGGDVFARLPKAERPSHVLYITVYAYYYKAGVLHVEPDGDMFVTGGQPTVYTALNGVTFPAGSAGMHKLKLRNDWISGQSRYGTGDPAYTVRNGVVYLSGSLHEKKAISNEIFGRLPAGARPAHNLFLSTVTHDDSLGWLEVRPSGVILAGSGQFTAAQDFTSLASVSFPVKS